MLPYEAHNRGQQHRNTFASTSRQPSSELLAWKMPTLASPGFGDRHYRNDLYHRFYYSDKLCGCSHLWQGHQKLNFCCVDAASPCAASQL